MRKARQLAQFETYGQKAARLIREAQAKAEDPKVPYHLRVKLVAAAVRMQDELDFWSQIKEVLRDV